MLYFRREEDDDGDEDEDEDEDEDPLGRPALAVYGDPSCEDSPPCDGLEYLRRVRKEAKALPAVVTAEINPSKLRAAEEKSASRMSWSLLEETAAALPPPPPSVRPRRKWQLQLLSDFCQLREQLNRKAVSQVGQSTRLPDPDDTSEWCRLIDPEDDFDASTSELMRAPTLSLIAQLSHLQAAAVLRLLTSRLSKQQLVPLMAGRWIFAVLARLDKELDADNAATVRSLLKACWQMRANIPPSRPISDVATLNLLITIAGGFFGQASRDEWLSPEDDP